jgi:prolyl-tRNA synthetase
MRMSQLVGRSIRETPRDAELPSHRYLLRAGFVRQYAAGIYGFLPLAKRSLTKIEAIVRDEMNRVEGQEISMPCLATKELWDESGRYAAIDKSMFRLADRNDKPMVLNMTHEEPVVFLARTELTSYKQLPAMMYQVQTKFRDEPRPRGGLIRTREFTMKDGYSFHASEADLEQYYYRVHEAYERVFKRCGMKRIVSVMSDNGMFGGRFSHEFQLVVPTGEDKLILCDKCDYRANEEIATSPYTDLRTAEQPLKKVPTPGQKTIEELVKFLSVKAEQTAKAVMFEINDRKDKTGKTKLPVVAFVRGDLDVVPMKLRTLIGSECAPASEASIKLAGAVAGSTGPMGLNLEKCLVAVDLSLLKVSNVVTGANEADQHWTNFNLERDFLGKLSEAEKKRVKTGDIATARPGDPCPKCNAPLVDARGIEVGNIFHLGTKYSASMKCTYLDQNGKAQPHIMGCYGIGVSRILASVIEESHDDKGIIFPISIAPFDVQLCALNRSDDTVRQTADKLYAELSAAGVNVLFDDRDEKAGSQFADADLIGLPVRVVVSPKTLTSDAGAAVEFKYRDNREPAKLVAVDRAVAVVRDAVAEEYRRFAR